MAAELAADLAALGYLGNDVDEDTRPLIRRPYRRLDLDPYGLLGDETELDEYKPEVDFSTPGAIVSEQLLYGWTVRSERGWAVLRRRAAVRLRPEPDHRGWRARGFALRLRDHALGVELEVLVDGSERQAYTISGLGEFEVRGPLPDSEDSLVRLDLTCVESPPLSRFGSTDEAAPCAYVETIKLTPPLAAR